MNRPVNLTPEEQKLILDYRLEKGVLDEDLFNKAVDELEKGGVGSGRVIGTTTNGKSVYETSTTSNTKEFTGDDHKDASRIHEKFQGSAYGRRNYIAQQHHMKMAKFHNQAVIKASKKKK
jgi:hypothetical protein